LLRVLLDRGAKQIGDPKQCHAVAIDGRAPKFDGGIVTRVDCVSLGIVVNQDGRRFYDEGEDFWPKRYAIWGRLVAQQPEQIGHVIIDQKAIGRFMPPVFPPVRAGTIRELARALGLDPATLDQTVRAFNAAVDPGRSITPASTTAAPRGSTRPSPIGRCRWMRRRSTPIRSGPGSPSPIWVWG
jgi:tricarballylate dehydrogenase